MEYCRAQIVLHEPYADMFRSDCLSRAKILKAARGVLDLAYGLSATSYDVSLLDHLPIVGHLCALDVLTFHSIITDGFRLM